MSGRRDSHRPSSDCGPECLPCEDAKSLMRQLTVAERKIAAVRRLKDSTSVMQGMGGQWVEAIAWSDVEQALAETERQP